MSGGEESTATRRDSFRKATRKNTSLRELSCQYPFSTGIATVHRCCACEMFRCLIDYVNSLEIARFISPAAGFVKYAKPRSQHMSVLISQVVLQTAREGRESWQRGSLDFNCPSAFPLVGCSNG